MWQYDSERRSNTEYTSKDKWWSTDITREQKMTISSHSNRESETEDEDSRWVLCAVRVSQRQIGKVLKCFQA